MADGIDEGVAYPLTSKRIKLNYLKHLAGELGLSTVAPRSDLEVMIYGKLTEMDHDVENMQVVITTCQEVETLSLKTVDGIVLAVSIPSELPATDPEEIDSETGRYPIFKPRNEAAADIITTVRGGSVSTTS